MTRLRKTPYRPFLRQLCSRIAVASFCIAWLTPIQAGSLITFNPNPDTEITRTVKSFDWSVSSAVIAEREELGGAAIPLAPGDNDVQLFAHASLGTVIDSNNFVVGWPANGIDWEVTVYLSSGIVANATTLASGDSSADFELDPGSSVNFFNIMHDDTPDADELAGTGFSDGVPILTGIAVELDGSYTADIAGPTFPLLDQSTADDWNGTETVQGIGTSKLAILVLDFDPLYFPSGVSKGSIIPFNTNANTPFTEIDPSKSYDRDDQGTTDTTVVGDVNGRDGTDLILQNDASNSFDFIPAEQACRVTGGGNDTSGLGVDPLTEETFYDGTFASGGVVIPAETETVCKGGKDGNKNCSVVTLSDEVTYDWSMGGQAGANTAGPNGGQPKGEWEHNNHLGPEGLQFAFHGGTASASDGTEIDQIICTDEGWCKQARPAPNKQIDFVGIGEFSNFQIDDSSFAGDGVHTFPGIGDVVAASSGCKPNGNGPNSCANNPDQVGTYHWFQVHIEDAGEPGSQKVDPAANCPLVTDGVPGHGNDPFLDPPRIDNPLDCGCADYYRITIYKGFEPDFNSEGEVTNPDKTNKIYEVYGYLDGGNFQIHPLTGFDLK